MEGRSFSVVKRYPHPRAAVWRAITEGDLMSRWLMENDFVPEEGRRFTMRADPSPGWDGVVIGKVTQVRDRERLTYTWSGTGDMPQTEVVWELSEPEDGGTEVRFSHSGFTGVKYRMISFLLERGWKDMLENGLPETVEDIADREEDQAGG